MTTPLPDQGSQDGGLKHYFCEDCDKKLTSLSGLTRHTTMMHLREPNYSERTRFKAEYFERRSRTVAFDDDGLRELYSHFKHGHGYKTLSATYKGLIDAELLFFKGYYLDREAQLKEQLLDEAIATVQQTYDDAKRRGEEMTSRNRNKFARQNETMGESYARNQGFKSGCLTVITALNKLRRRV